MKIYMQLNFPGNCAQAFQYYAEHLGGKQLFLMTQSQAPGATPARAGELDPVIHARMAVAGTVLIANDVPKEHLQPMRSAYLYLEVDSAEEAERVYAALMEGGEAYIPLGETFFATRFAQLRDRFGVLWSLIHPKAAL